MSVDELMARRPSKADNPFVESETVEDGNPANEHEPKLDLPQLQTGVGNYSHGAHVYESCTSHAHLVHACEPFADALTYCKHVNHNMACTAHWSALALMPSGKVFCNKSLP